MVIVVGMGSVITTWFFWDAVVFMVQHGVDGYVYTQ
jgi:hypothetical protein